VNGLLNRVVNVGQPQLDLRFDDHAFPPYNLWVHAGTVSAFVAILLPALLWRGGAHDRLLDLCTMLVSVTLASPIAWEHHYGVLLPIFAIVVASVPPRRGWIVWLAASYVLVSTFFAASKLLAPSLLNVAQSYRLAGGALLLGLLYLHRRNLSAGVGRVAEEHG
jgi:alpha-1,2-mannosyltransferase